VINLTVYLPIRKCQREFMYVVMLEHTLDRLLDVAKFTTLIPLSLLILCKFLFSVVGLKMSSLPTLALKSPNKSFMWDLGIPSKTHSSS
jgi:hypothetical protein